MNFSFLAFCLALFFLFVYFCFFPLHAALVYLFFYLFFIVLTISFLFKFIYIFYIFDHLVYIFCLSFSCSDVDEPYFEVSATLKSNNNKHKKVGEEE